MSVTEIVYYFAVYSFIGWAFETAYVSFKSRRFMNRGFLSGPFSPIYGFGAVFMILFSMAVTSAPFPLFFFGFFFLSALEYMTSVFMEKAFGAKWWTYKESPLNIKGRVALFPSVFWGVISVFAVIFIHPYIVSLFFGWTGSTAGTIGAGFLVACFSADAIFSSVIARRLCRHIGLTEWEDATDSIKNLPFSEKRMALASPDFVKGILKKKFT